MHDALLLFDIDGTLVHVAEEIAFVRAFADVFGEGVDARWPVGVTASDTSFIAAVVTRCTGQVATEAEVANVVERFVAHLDETVTTGLTPVRPVAGAREFVATCAARGPVAIATGCVEPSARLKLRHAGIEHHFGCGGFSTQEVNRAEIVQRAIHAAERHYGRRFAPSQIVSLGDGPWDVDAARALDLHFIGINERPRGREKLAAAGASFVVPDFTDDAAIWRAIAEFVAG